MSAFSLRTANDRMNFANAVKALFTKKGTTLTCADIAAALDANLTQVRNVLHGLIEDGMIEAKGNTRARTYTLVVSASELQKAA